MIEVSPEIVTIIMLGGVLVALIFGYPIAFVIGGIGVLVGLLLFGGKIIAELYYSRVFLLLINYVLLAVPLFVFMGLMLERSGVAAGLYDTLYIWFGGFRGGLAITTVLVGTIVAACVGVIGASVTMLTLIALPSMIGRGYNKSLAAGSVCAGGTLGILIPPSIMLVVYGPMAGVSVGKLFFGAIMPGLLLSGLYCLYIAGWCLFKPQVGPALPAVERRVPLARKTRMLLVSLVAPGALILAVLGSIFFGIAAPTEAAAVGAFVATLLAIAYRKFNFQMLKDVALATMRVSGFVMLLSPLAFAFAGVFVRAGCGGVIGDLVLSAPGGKWSAFAIMMLTTFIMGMFMDWIGIVFVLVPIITPIGAALGFDPVWFAIMVCINLQMGFMTPPVAFAIFFLKGSVSPELGLTTADIIRGIVPFVILIMIAIGLCIAFPDIILWLPEKML